MPTSDRPGPGLEVTVAVHHERPPPAREHLALNQLRRMRVAPQQPGAVLVGISHLTPIDGRIAEKDP
jgi:hypothetical protein